MAMETVPSSCESSSIDISSDKNLPDFKYADNVLLLSNDSSKMLVFLTVWAVGYVCLGCCCRTELAQSRTSLLQQNRWRSWIDLGTRVVTRLEGIVYWNKCLYAYRRCGWCLLIWSVCEDRVTSGYWSKVEHTRQKWGQHCSATAKHGNREQVCVKNLCLNIAVFAELVEYSEGILGLSQSFGTRYWVLGFSLYYGQCGWGRFGLAHRTTTTFCAILWGW